MEYFGIFDLPGDFGLVDDPFAEGLANHIIFEREGKRGFAEGGDDEAIGDLFVGAVHFYLLDPLMSRGLFCRVGRPAGVEMNVIGRGGKGDFSLPDPEAVTKEKVVEH